MQRLLEEAERLSGVEYDISSFADIVDAIHVVQTEMGITGTTALEASTTIQGSISSMKSAWTNLVTGVADEDADLDTLITNFVDSVGTVAQNVVPKIGVALNSASMLISELIPVIVKEIPKLIEQNLPVLVKAAVGIVQSIVDGISENQEMLMPTAIETIAYLADSLISMLPQIVALGLDLIVSLANGIAESLPELVPTIIDVVLQIVETLTNPETLVSLVDAALAIIVALASGLIDAIPTLIERIPIIIENIIAALQGANASIIGAGFTLVLKLAEGLIKAIPQLILAIPQIVLSLVNGFASNMVNVFNIGKDIVSKIGEGFKSMLSGAKTWGKDMIDNFIGGIKEKWNKLKDTVSNVAQSVKDFLGFSEPKKGPLSNFHTYAPDMMDLFAKGIKDNESVVTGQIEKSFDFGERTIGFAAEYSGSTGRTVGAGATFGNVTININGAKYTDEQSLAEAVAEALQNMTDRKAAIYA